MNTKLTIKLDEDIITRAKTYAKHRKTSLSRMIESYLDSVTKPNSGKIKITPLVKSLSGVIALPDAYDYKKEYADYLTRKYSWEDYFLIRTSFLTCWQRGCLSLADKKKLTLSISSLCLADIHYILSGKNPEMEVRKILMKFKVLVNVLSLDDKITDLALNSDFRDFEDAIQYYTALENEQEMIITRNHPDFKESKLPVMTAGEFIKAISI